MSSQEFDLIVIGAGPGGYVCAIRAAQLGLKTALVEKRKTLGGTCLNIGCIPSKALLHSTELYHVAKHEAKSHGLEIGEIKVDVSTLMKKKEDVVSRLVKGVETLVKKRDITILNGHGKLLGDGKVEIKNGDKAETVKAKSIVLATGSKPVEFKHMPFDGEVVVSSDQAIAFDKVPEKLVVVGGGAIGLELGTVWSRLGSEVTVLEFLPRIAATYDADITKNLERIFKKQGLKVETEAKVTGVQPGEGKKKALVSYEKKGKTVEIEADKVLVAAGRAPVTEGLGLEEVGVSLDKKGRVVTGPGYTTNVKGVYAIGDIISGPMLAHKAEEEGVALAEILAGKHGEVNYEVIPNVIYTEPEVASVGIGEDEAKESGINVNVGKFPLAANGRAIAMDATEGFIKVIADAKTDRILGVQMLAKNASELIGLAVTHMEYGGSAEDLGRTVHAHPTLSESFKEAGLAVSKQAIHSL